MDIHTCAFVFFLIGGESVNVADGLYIREFWEVLNDQKERENSLLKKYTTLQKLRHNLFYCFLLFCIILQLMNLRTWNSGNKFVMKWLVEFYITVALGIIFKRILMKTVIKICFFKSKIWILFGKKTNWKMVLRTHYW